MNNFTKNSNSLDMDIVKKEIAIHEDYLKTYNAEQECEKYDLNELLNAMCRVSSALYQRPKSIVVELQTYRKHVPTLLQGLINYSKWINVLTQQNARLSEIDYEKSNKRWTPDEDNKLIEIICGERENIHTISAMFGRSPSAIKSRITYLVGVKRLSQSVVGKFIGTINDEEVEGEIKGIVKKEA